MTSCAHAADTNADPSTVNSTYLPSTPSVVTATSPTWAQPKSPLSPHRLAKLANALGVSTPLPATHQSMPFLSRSFLEPPTTSEAFRRSPTPCNVCSYTPTVSKYLLHVIPPMYLSHDTNATDMTPPPASASGYHTQFRRGILVPVHSNLQSQLNAIAKEYALPSTAGMILYLVSSAKDAQSSVTPSDDLHEPGPRLSEDIWKRLWTRVLASEQRDDVFMPLPSRSPLGMSLGTQSTPYLPQESSQQPLRPFLSSGSVTPPNFPSPTSPTTPSTVSDLRSNTRSSPPSDSSATDSETRATSLGAPSIIKDHDTHTSSLDLPGLASPSIIPILAKVEFDIDLRKATWYEPWLRSRRLNHAKRAESRNGRQAIQGYTEDPHDEHPRHIGLLTGNKAAQSTISLALPSAEEDLTTEDATVQVPAPTLEGYQQLDEQEEDREENGGWSDDSADDEFESTARVATLTLANHKDALADVFGTDAETWAEMRSSSPRKSNRLTNPNIVDLALDAADLTALPSPTESEFEKLGNEEDEVQALLDQMARPTLSVSIPTSPSETPSSSPITGNKKHVPPPLTLVANPPANDLTIPIGSTPSSASSSGLAYLHDDEELTEENQEGDYEKDYTRVKSPAESLKREGAVFDDIHLGLDLAEDVSDVFIIFDIRFKLVSEQYDDSDPNDRRHSQFLMMAQLDEIERTIAQLSPRILQDDLADEQRKYLPLSPTTSMTPSPRKLNEDSYPPSPMLPQHLEVPDSPIHDPKATWPSMPVALTQNVSSPHQDDVPPSPPSLAVNGVTTSAPKSFISNSSGKLSEESESRKLELEEQQSYHRRPVPPKPLIDANSDPIIPLSPDPFGRFASTPPPPPGEQPSSVYWEKDAMPDISNISAVDIPPPIDSPDGRKRSNSSATSRFSADSITGIEANSKLNRSTLMSVNTIKKLWRKNTKNPSSKLPPIPSSSPTTAVPPVPVPSKSDEPPKDLRTARLSPQLPSRPSQGMPPPPVPKAPPPQHLVPVMPQRLRTVSHSQSLSEPSQLPKPPPQESAPPVPPKSQSPMPYSQHLPYPSSKQRPPTPYSLQQSQDYVPSHQQVTIPQQSSVRPLFNGMSTNPQPIVVTKMRPGRSNSSLDHFKFDQETPYPITTRRPRANSRPPSPPIPSPSLQPVYSSPPTPTLANGNLSITAPAPLQEKPSVRKSILKSRKSSSISSIVSIQPMTAPELRTSTEQLNAKGVRPRRPSIINVGLSRQSVTSSSPDIPPSPQIPQQFINDKRHSIRSKLTNSSIDSSHSVPQLSSKLSGGSNSRRSMASSRSSQESRPSFDTSQFEMVSPKMNPAVYYHRLNHSMDSSTEGR
ncbi:hypothetical protein C0993_008909 [Termitomyces sp. T159_Od127]|nr:hypothetical protein C0993_008909 [Termitomyces sp. T159_Od127]